MDTTCLSYRLTDQQRREFDDNGFFIVEQALPPAMVEELAAGVDRLDAQYRAPAGQRDGVAAVRRNTPSVIQPNRPPKHLLAADERLNLLDVVGREPAFLELLDWPKTFGKVWDILGWNLQLYHSHMTVTPPSATAKPQIEERLHWHQDSGRLNLELESQPQPRVSLKIGFFLTDMTATGRGNFYVVPGSHLRNDLVFPDGAASNPTDALPICVAPGTAVYFDRRLWHSASPNYSDITRKVLFYGYSYRWLRPRDDMTVSHLLDQCDPIRKQLLGVATGGFGYTSPSDEDVPLKTWLEKHVGAAAGDRKSIA